VSETGKNLSSDKIDKMEEDVEIEASESPLGSTRISEDDVMTLSGHNSEVFTVQWNPDKLLLASG
jgi:hypothetical protein